MSRYWRLTLGALGLVVGLSGPGSAQVWTVSEDKGKDETFDKRIERRIVIGASGAFLGVGLEDVDADDARRLKLPEEQGARVASVEPGSPAEKGGVQKDDVIVRFNGEAVRSASQLSRLVRETPAGRKVALDLYRGGVVQKVSATLAERKGGRRELVFEGGPEAMVLPHPPEMPDPPVFHWRGEGGRQLMWLGERPRKLGLEYQEIRDQLARYFKLSGDRGVLVTNVEPSGPAEKAGIKAGDILLSVGGTKIDSAEALDSAVRKVELGQEVAITLLREGKSLEVKLMAGGKPRAPTRGDDI
jgi:serine protease Do